MVKIVARGVVCLAAIGLAFPAAAAEYKTVKSEKYGYSFEIPAQFQMEGKEDKTTSWIYQPGSASTKEKKTKKKLKLGGRINVGGLSIGGSKETEDSSAGSGGGLESALMVYVNWVWMPDVASKTLFDTNMQADLKNINSPDPDYTDLVVLNKENGYPNFEGGYAYAYKEVNKDSSDEIHRWHIKAFGNKSSYTIGLTGTYGQFDEWGPEFEKVVKSFKLIPLKEN